MSVAVQYVVRPNPGTDPAKITELAKEGAALWRKHGGKVTYWTVAVGEVGNRVLSITFENFAAYGAAVDKMGEDKEVRAWQAKRMKAWPSKMCALSGAAVASTIFKILLPTCKDLIRNFCETISEPSARRYFA